MDRLREKHRIDPARACSGKDIGQDAQAQAVGALDLLQKVAIGPRHAIQRGRGGLVEGPARPRQVPDFLGDAVHVDRKADAAIADKGKAQFLLAHGSV